MQRRRGDRISDFINIVLVLLLVIAFSAILLLLNGCGSEPFIEDAPNTYNAFGAAVDGLYIGRSGGNHVGKHSKIMMLSPVEKELFDCYPYDCRGGAVGMVNGKPTILTARWYSYDFEEYRIAPTIDFLEINVDGLQSTLNLDLGPRANCYGNIREDTALCYGHLTDNDYLSVAVNLKTNAILVIQNPGHLGETDWVRLSDGTILAVARSAIGGMEILRGPELASMVPVGFYSDRITDHSPRLYNINGITTLFYADRATMQIKVAQWNGDRFGKPKVLYTATHNNRGEFGYPSYSNGLVYFHDLIGSRVDVLRMEY